MSTLGLALTRELSPSAHSCVLVTLEIKSADKAAEVAKHLVQFAEGYRKDQGTLDWIVTQDPKVGSWPSLSWKLRRGFDEGKR